MKQLNLLKLISIMLITLEITFCISFKASYSLSFKDELIIDKNQVVLFEETLIIQTKNIIIKDNGTLIIKHATLQLSIRGEKAYNITIEDNGKLILQAGTISSLNKGSIIFLKGYANLTMIDGSLIEGFYAIILNGNSTIFMDKSKIKNLELVHGKCKSFKALSSLIENSLTSLNASYIDFVGFVGNDISINATSISLTFFNSKSLKLFSKNEINAFNIKSSDALIYSEKKLIIKDSSFSTLIAGKFGELYNVTTLGKLTKAGGEVYAYQNSTLFRYWYLKVEVLDIIKTKIPAKIIIYDLNKTIIQQGKSDFEGKFEKPILSEIINITKSNFVGNYKIQAIYENYSTPIEPLTMDFNKEILLIFDKPIPFATAVFIEISSSKVKVGDSITISGKIDPGIDDALIELTYVRPDGSKLLIAKTTSLNGSFSDSFKPDSVGEWKVYATWITNDEMLLKNRSRISKTLVFIVESKPSLITLLLTMFPAITGLMAIIIGVAVLIIQKRRRI